MSTPDPRQPVHLRERRSRAAWFALGLVVLALAPIGIWFSLRPSATALMPDMFSLNSIEPRIAFAAHASRRTIANVEFEDGSGRQRSLADFRGKVVLLNIWATWCAPCRQEMPTLDRLQSLLGGSDFEVVALSIDRGGQAAVKSFFDEIDAQQLAIYVDVMAEAGTRLGIIGLPTTLLLDPAGREIGRVTGPAEWDRPEVIEAIRYYLPPRAA